VLILKQKYSENSQPVNMVKTMTFGDIQVPSPGFGAMGLSFGLGNNLTLEQAEPVLLKALELGCTFWDTAVSGGASSSSSNIQNLTAHDAGCLFTWNKRNALRGLH
jgi:hypothetical protein